MATWWHGGVVLLAALPWCTWWFEPAQPKHPRRLHAAGGGFIPRVHATMTPCHLLFTKDIRIEFSRSSPVPWV